MPCPFRIGNGYDIHVIAPNIPMWLCGKKISDELGFVAHSDGDVAIHALCDALLGALAIGDIGHHFPDTSPKWKGISSLKLLSRVVELVSEKGYSIANVDITISLQSPKIARHIDDMKLNLSSALGIEKSCISIKATTAEGLGFVGRLEGCQVWATALLYQNA